MVFKNPAILYGLFFLIIPIIVHLFQLRRFSKVAFTNVAFLKPLITQTRKSRQLKKWLTLLMRLLAISCIVLAFAQPFLPGSDTATQEKQTAIYLDNSYSMQAQGQNGALYKDAVTQLLEKMPADKVFTIFTNDKVYANTNKQQVANDLLNGTYSGEDLSYEQIQIKANSLLQKKNTLKEIILISDFQNKYDEPFADTLTGIKRELVKLTPENLNNISVDSVFISSRTGKELSLEAQLSSNYEVTDPLTINVYNGEILLAKTSVDLENKKGKAVFDLELTAPINGKISIEDDGLSFVNELFISSGSKQEVNVLSINGAGSGYLDRLYNGNEFNYISVKESDVNYNLIKQQNLVVLNQLQSIPSGLVSELNQLMQNGGYLVIIPAMENNGYEALGISGMEVNDSEKKITTINFNHPLLRDVFNKQVTNFQYPRVNTSLKTINELDPILKYEDGSSFLYQKGNQYIFTASIDEENSNFQNSPLIVPIFYNMAINALPVPKLYYEIGTTNEVAIPVAMEQDQILSLVSNETRIIPRQKAFDSFVLITTGEEIKEPGSYEVLKENESVATISFNLNRLEQSTNYYTDAELGNNLSSNVDDLLYKISQEENILALWKYFVIGALFFLICELLILKYLK